GPATATRLMRGLGLAALMACPPGLARAASLYSGDGLEVRWDNTIRYSAGFRVASQSPILLAYPNSDDGDGNFAPGLISNRFDLMSVLDVTGDDFGVQASLAAWYDSVYFAHTDNVSPSTYNALSV